MNGTTGIAIYGAVVATGALGWQIYVWRQSRRLRVTVKVSQMLPAMPNPEWWIGVTVINHEDHQIRVSSVGFELQDGSGRKLVLVHPPLAANLPGIVAAHEEGFTYMSESSSELSQFDLRRPLIGWANLATGETIRSKPATLRRK